MLEARYYQPNSAQSVLVKPKVEAGYLVIENAVAFPLDQIELTISGHAANKIMIRCLNDGAALLFNDADILQILADQENRKLQAQCQVIQKQLKGQKSKEGKYWASVVGIFAAVLIGGTIGFNLFIDWATWHLDPKLEAEIGKSVSKSASWDAKSPQLERLNRIGGKLASQLDSSPFPFSFHVKKVKEINAFAYPGGVIAVDQGLLDMASDDELAGVLGHEMGHVLHHDTVHHFLRDMGAKSVITLIAGAASEEQVSEILSVAQKLDSIRFSRTQETEADVVGIDLALKAGYDGAGLVKFFERMKKMTGEENKLLALISDHPLDSERIESIKKEIARYKSTGR